MLNNATVTLKEKTFIKFENKSAARIKNFWNFVQNQFAVTIT